MAWLYVGGGLAAFGVNTMLRVIGFLWMDDENGLTL
jgi:hypothetical protein